VTGAVDAAARGAVGRRRGMGDPAVAGAEAAEGRGDGGGGRRGDGRAGAGAGAGAFGEWFGAFVFELGFLRFCWCWRRRSRGGEKGAGWVKINKGRK
jgi:hypothetical protein